MESHCPNPKQNDLRKNGGAPAAAPYFSLNIVGNTRLICLEGGKGAGGEM